MSRRHRMLMVSPAWPWPATTGGLVRIAAIVRQMARFFDLTLVSPGGTDQPPPDITARFVRVPARPLGSGARVRALLTSSKPFHVAQYRNRAVAAAVTEELSRQQFDVAYSHFIYGLEYDYRTLPVIVDQQNVDRDYWGNKARLSPFPLNALAALNTRRTIRYEERALRRIWAYVSVSDQDRERTRTYAGGSVRHFWVAANGVDTRRFVPAAEAPDPPGRITLGYLGSMDLQMNVDAVQYFCSDILPRIRTALPDLEVQLLVIGREPATGLKSLASATRGVTLSGTVDDVVPWIQRVSILVCPLRIGAGTKLKVAEAMSCGLPVVGTSLAFAGLGGVSGEHFIRADTADDFASAVCELARWPSTRQAMGSRARAFTRAHLEWDAIGERLHADIAGALAQRADA